MEIVIFKLRLRNQHTCTTIRRPRLKISSNTSIILGRTYCGLP